MSVKYVILGGQPFVKIDGRPSVGRLTTHLQSSLKENNMEQLSISGV